MQKTIDILLANLIDSEFASYISSHRFLSDGVRAMKNAPQVRKLIMCGLNSNKAYNVILDEFGKYSDKYDVDEDSKSELDEACDIYLAALLLVVIAIDPAMGSIVSGIVLNQDTWWARAVAYSHILNQELTSDRICESA